MTITVGVDTFVSVADADDYMSKRLHAEAWPVLAVDPNEPTGIWQEPVEENAAKLLTKEQALRLATQTLNSQRYRGRVTSCTQTLALPRAFLCDREGRSIPDDEIPQAFKAATCELALVLIRDDLTNEAVRRELYRLKSSKIGESSATYRPHVGIELPAIVRDLIGEFLESQSSLPIRP